MYEILLHKKAARYYGGLDDRSARRINKAIGKISENPHEGRNIKKLKGRHEGKCRYAVGALRIVYRVEDKKGMVLIEAIGPRGDVYK